MTADIHRFEDRVVIVEDDTLTAHELAELFGEEGLAAEIIDAESHFIARLPSWKEAPPAAFVVDVMLRWDHPHSGTPDDELLPPDFHSAGLRCVSLLANAGLVHPGRTVLLTALPKEEVESTGITHGVSVVRKGLSWTPLQRALYGIWTSGPR